MAQELESVAQSNVAIKTIVYNAVRRTGAIWSIPAACVGHALEYYLVLPNSFQQFSFELVPRLHHSIVLLLSAFSPAWFKAIGSAPIRVA